MKRIALCVLFLIIACNAFCQTLRLDAGLTFSRIEHNFYFPGAPNDYDYSSYKAPVINHSTGLYIEYLEQKYFSVTSGIHIYRTGGKYTEMELKAAANQPGLMPKISLDYISLNNTINFSPINKKIMLQFQLGPRLDYLISTKFAPNVEEKAKINYGITTGAGIYYKTSKYQVGINALHFGREKPLFDVISNKSGAISEHRFRVEEKFWLLNMSLGYKLSFKE